MSQVMICDKVKSWFMHASKMDNPQKTQVKIFKLIY